MLRRCEVGAHDSKSKKGLKMRLAATTLVWMAFVATLGYPTVPAKLPPMDTCSGDACVDFWDCIPPSHWSITPITWPGQGLSPTRPCTYCDPCEASIYWSYTGTGPWSVRWGVPGSAAGFAGPASGGFSIDTDCDEEPYDCEFCGDTGTFYGTLYCTCE